MVQRNIVVVEGHPDGSDERLNHVLATEYGSAAERAGHRVRSIRIADLAIPLIRTAREFFDEPPPAQIVEVQQTIASAAQLTMFYPMWLGGMPGLFRAFIEQVFRPGFTPDVSVHFVVTMDAPTAVYRLYLRTFLKHLHRNVLQFSEIASITETVLGGLVAPAPVTIEKWRARMREYGKSGR